MRTIKCRKLLLPENKIVFLHLETTDFCNLRPVLPDTVKTALKALLLF
jgi:hypothetical protein